MILVYGIIDLVRKGHRRKAIDLSNAPRWFADDLKSKLMPSVNAGVMSLRMCERWEELAGEAVDDLTPPGGDWSTVLP